MAWAAWCRDRTDGEAPRLRERYLQAHLDYIADIRAQVLVAGPLRLGDGPAFSGSLFVYATDDDVTARRLLEDDPYHRAGLYADVTLAPFVPARGTWL